MPIPRTPRGEPNKSERDQEDPATSENLETDNDDEVTVRGGATGQDQSNDEFDDQNSPGYDNNDPRSDPGAPGNPSFDDTHRQRSGNQRYDRNHRSHESRRNQSDPGARHPGNDDSDDEGDDERESPSSQIKSELDRYNRDIGGIPQTMSAQYRRGDLPVNYETKLQNRCIDSVANICIALTHSLREIGGPNTHLEKLIGEWVSDLRTTAQHYDHVSGQLALDHEPPTLARRPNFGKKNQIPQVKPGYFPVFEGDGEDTLVFLNWIDVIFAFLDGYTPRVHMDMLTRQSKGRALSIIVQWRNEDRSNVEEVVRFLEQEVGGIVSSEVAINYLNQLTLVPGESIGSIASVIHQYALMAHARDSPGQREENINATEKRYILRLLPPKLLKQYNDFAQAAKVAGKPEMSSREMVKHLIRLNQQNIDAEENHRIAVRMAKTGQVNEVQHVAAGRRPKMSRHKRIKPPVIPHTRGRVRTIVPSSEVLHIHDEVEAEEEDDDEVPGLVPESEEEEDDEDDDQGVFEIRERVRYSPAHFGVKLGECYKCGMKGHRYRGPTSDRCPLRKFDLEMHKCSRCKKGGHKAETCVNRKN